MAPDLFWLLYYTLSGSTLLPVWDAAYRTRGLRRRISLIDAAQVTEIPARSSDYIYFVTAVFVLETFAFVLIRLSGRRQLWRHGILSLGLLSNFREILSSDKY